MAKRRKVSNKGRKTSNPSFEKKEKKESSMGREVASYVIIIVVGIILAQHLNVVVSGSMEPVFYRGDVVVVEKTNLFGLGLQEVNPSDLKVGDIIIYQATWFPEPVIHRIISVQTGEDGQTYYVTKGDNNPQADPALVSTSQVQAKVVSIGDQPLIIPKIGYITLWIRGL
ncbi:signal peptidase I [Methanobacterium ferruginis]|jgi:signal peptidase|uniref:signal peptidase I n=1 Tax=Methanobacterium ferruginis TaxID=710191 RepID=UPI0025732A89|nr:signal peptidase I [Methanobacterium ferruginis]MCC7550836.1 signal peptidase I [Methanobacterium sp.]BDZ67303.1 S26 family signal peptidase [Methanobacterium ferruginis]